jgi:hypothetical protein
MPAIYDRLGLHFHYPENWVLDESPPPDDQCGAGAELGSVAVHSPGGGFWMVAQYQGSTDPKRHVEAALNTLRELYDNLDDEAVRETVHGHKMVGYDVNFFCLDLTNTAVIRGWRTPDRTLLLLCQAEDREFEQLQQVFSAMTASLLLSLSRLM